MPVYLLLYTYIYLGSFVFKSMCVSIYIYPCLYTYMYVCFFLYIYMYMCVCLFVWGFFYGIST